MQKVFIKMHFNEPASSRLGCSCHESQSLGRRCHQDHPEPVSDDRSTFPVQTDYSSHNPIDRLLPIACAQDQCFPMADGLTDFDQDQLFTNHLQCARLGSTVAQQFIQWSVQTQPLCVSKVWSDPDLDDLQWRRIWISSF